MSESKTTVKTPKLWEFSGPVSDKGSFHLRVVCSELNTRHLRQVIKVLEMTAGWFEEDECAKQPPLVITRFLDGTLQPATECADAKDAN